MLSELDPSMPPSDTPPPDPPRSDPPIAEVTLAEVAARVVHTTYAYPGHGLTLCHLALDNGYIVDGESYCADARLYKPNVGRRLARERALSKIYPLLQFLAYERRFRGEGG